MGIRAPGRNTASADLSRERRLFSVSQDPVAPSLHATRACRRASPSRPAWSSGRRAGHARRPERKLYALSEICTHFQQVRIRPASRRARPRARSTDPSRAPPFWIRLARISSTPRTSRRTSSRQGPLVHPPQYDPGSARGSTPQTPRHRERVQRLQERAPADHRRTSRHHRPPPGSFSSSAEAHPQARRAYRILGPASSDPSDTTTFWGARHHPARDQVGDQEPRPSQTPATRSSTTPPSCVSRPAPDHFNFAASGSRRRPPKLRSSSPSMYGPQAWTRSQSRRPPPSSSSRSRTRRRPR